MPQNILPQQPRTFNLCPVNQPLNLGQVNQQINLGQIGQPLNLGQIGQPFQFGQPVNLGQLNQPLTFGTVNQALNLGQVSLGPMNQVIGGQTHIRLAAMPNFSFNSPQLVSPGQAVLNFQVCCDSSTNTRLLVFLSRIWYYYLVTFNIVDVAHSL